MKKIAIPITIIQEKYPPKTEYRVSREQGDMIRQRQDEYPGQDVRIRLREYGTEVFTDSIKLIDSVEYEEQETTLDTTDMQRLDDELNEFKEEREGKRLLLRDGERRWMAKKGAVRLIKNDDISITDIHEYKICQEKLTEYSDWKSRIAYAKKQEAKQLEQLNV